jgi:DNA-binding NarL/FixJ family response regulator
VVGVFASLREAEEYLTEYAAHILILDDQTLTPIEVIRLVARCHESRPGLGIIVMSQRRDSEYIQRVMRWGTASFLLKTGRLQEHLLKALQFNSSHYPFISPEALKLLGTRPMGTLTHRDRRAVLIGTGTTSQEIGERLGITAKTVYRIRDTLKKLLNVGNTDSLVDAARKQRLLDRE